MESRTKYESLQCWKSPEDALDDLNYICNFGVNDRPFQSTECFQVWGRGRPRPPVSQIILPKGVILPPDFPRERPAKGKGRGHLLLQGSSPKTDSKSNTVHINNVLKDTEKSQKHKSKQRSVNTRQNMTLKDLEDKYNKAKHLGTRKTMYDLNCDFPPLPPTVLFDQ
ncbi:uncharacterized protein LOC132088308 [Daphnia carinata]|uniref:uncharacterized protein LOC132088308 n=1 Tax=Daphnia carinata TaxID=120202 RepID=UPI0028684B6F|nr:uncharacterized protein LOC132088308 [Daphnia carinata]